MTGGKPFPAEFLITATPSSVAFTATYDAAKVSFSEGIAADLGAPVTLPIVFDFTIPEGWEVDTAQAEIYNQIRAVAKAKGVGFSEALKLVASKGRK